MLIIFIISIIIYTIAGVMINHNLYNYDKAYKIKYIIIGFIITFIITVILCFISTNGIIANENYITIVRNTSILLFSPINAIISLPYIGNLLNKYEDKRINEKKLKKKLLLFGIILIIIFIFEVAYIKDFELGLIKSAIQKTNNSNY